VCLLKRLYVTCEVLSVVCVQGGLIKSVKLPCHHGMAYPQVAVGGVGLQISRVAPNILNTWSQTADGVTLYLGGWAGV
jgi:hypothetical protein